jgi:hypothetical protein
MGATGIAAVATKLFKSAEENAKKAMTVFFGEKMASGLINEVGSPWGAVYIICSLNSLYSLSRF